MDILTHNFLFYSTILWNLVYKTRIIKFIFHINSCSGNMEYNKIWIRNNFNIKRNMKSCLISWWSVWEEGTRDI
jgi:hypothetical protein